MLDKILVGMLKIAGIMVGAGIVLTFSYYVWGWCYVVSEVLSGMRLRRRVIQGKVSGVGDKQTEIKSKCVTDMPVGEEMVRDMRVAGASVGKKKKRVKISVEEKREKQRERYKRWYAKKKAEKEKKGQGDKEKKPKGVVGKRERKEWMKKMYSEYRDYQRNQSPAAATHPINKDVMKAMGLYMEREEDDD